MPTPKELFDAIERQEQDVYEAAGGDATRSGRDVYEELIEAEKKLEEATERGGAEVIEEAKRECEESANELVTLIDGLEVDLHNMAVDVGDLKEVVLEGYAFSDA